MKNEVGAARCFLVFHTYTSFIAERFHARYAGSIGFDVASAVERVDDEPVA